MGELVTSISTLSPGAFGKMLAILVQVKCLGAIVEACNAGDRKGDSVVPRSEAGEDARVEVQHTTSSTRTITIVVVGQERVNCHSLGRCDTVRLIGRDENI